MDSLIYFLLEHYPWWGVPSALIAAETANHFRRVGRRPAMFFFGAIAALLVILVVAYFFYNGFSNLRPAMKEIERQYSK